MPCSCCAGDSLDIFSEKGARRELRRYLSKGLGGEDAQLIADWAQEGGLEGATVLEVGGGIGQIQAELVRRGAEHGRVLEVVADYEGPAGELARATGIEEHTFFALGDLLQDADVEPADVVVLRRVVCCSPEGSRLLGTAATRARRTLLASYPRNRALVRVTFALQNGIFALMRKRFRAFVHSPADLEQAAAESGLTRVRISRGVVWETAQFDAA